MSESAALFGPESSLVGVYNDAGSAAPICCLLINAGVLPRVGANRLNVKIARALAARGMASMRFDLAGIGDSRPPSRAASYQEQATADIQAAMDFVERTGGPHRFVIFGICSGAVNALGAGLADRRIAGVMMLDGFWYHSSRTELMRLLKRLRNKSFAGVLAALWRRLRGAAGAGTAAVAAAVDLFSVDGSGNPPKADFARDLNAITARGVDVFFMYTGSVPEQVSYEGQLRDAFSGEPFVKRVRCELHDDLDHTAVPLDSQRKLLGMIADWTQQVGARVRSAAPSGNSA